MLQSIFEIESWTDVFIVSTLEIFLRYFSIAGIFFLVLYVWKPRFWLHRKIQQAFPSSKKVWTEVIYSASSVVVFSIISVGITYIYSKGYTRIYNDVGLHGWAYHIFSYLLATVLHDAYFYWTHRFMHLKWVYPIVHKVHHISSNPTPWSAFCFHPLEAIIQIAYLPIIITLLPLHYSSVALIAFLMIFWNIYGHAGYEFHPRWVPRHWWSLWSGTPTFHNMHHSKGKQNYAIYFTWWDIMMGTVHKDYKNYYESVKSRKDNKKDQIASQ